MTNHRTRGPAQDRLFSAVFAGATGSAAVALLFLVLDALRGDAFATPSLLGSVLFLGVAPGDVATVRLDMVALYSLAHLTAFAALGVAATAVHATAATPIRSPFVLAGLLLATLSGGAFMVDTFAFPGLVETIGPGTIILANAVASGAMAGFIHATTS
jgi:hypothetical protein